jgi:hypothetical protein
MGQLVDVTLDATGECAEDADYVYVGVWATAGEEGDEVVPFAALQMLTHYDADSLTLVGYEEGDYPWLLTDPFPHDAPDINDDIGDGQAMLVCYARWFEPPFTPIFVGSLVFQVLSGEDSCVDIKTPYPPYPDIRTRVSSPGVFGEVTGTLTNDCADDCLAPAPTTTLVGHEMLVPGGRAPTCSGCHTTYEAKMNDCVHPMGPSPCHPGETECCANERDICNACVDTAALTWEGCCLTACPDRFSRRSCILSMVANDIFYSMWCAGLYEDCMEL